MAEHNDIGKRGEEIALAHLQKQGYKIEAINWRYKKAEIDIMAWKDDYFVVVEVKTRTSTEFESPKEAVTLGKQKHLVRAADAYIQEKEIEKECRFDVVSVLIQNNNVSIEHIEDAFQPLL